MHRCLALAVIAVTIVSARPGYAQRLPAPWQRAVPAPILRPPALDAVRPTWTWPPDAGNGPRTYRLEGALIGGVAIGLLGAITGIGFCHFDSPCRHPVPFAIGGFALGALAGVGLGGRIGEAFPKGA